MTDLAVLTKRNQTRWDALRITRGTELLAVARRLLAQKSRYLAISAKTGVPWFIIAVIHERESGQDFAKSLAQGDPWNRVSVNVPRGRGPFSSFEEAAVDALVKCGPYAARWKDWSAGGALCLLEQYNGLGYAARGLPSPYIWSGTDQYKSGKYVADHVYDPDVIDRQLGCAGLLRAMMQIDQTITFTSGKIIPLDPPPDAKPIPPVPVPKPSIWAAFLSLVLSFFKRK